jgi:hypothetical protein
VKLASIRRDSQRSAAPLRRRRRILRLKNKASKNVLKNAAVIKVGKLVLTKDRTLNHDIKLAAVLTMDCAS